MNRRTGEDPNARQSIDTMVGMILAENEEQVAADEEKAALDLRDQRRSAWQKMKDRLRGLHVRGDLSKKEHDEMLAALTEARNRLRSQRVKLEKARKADRALFKLALPPRPTVQAAFDIARGAARRADGEDKPVETLGAKQRRKPIVLTGQ